MTGYLEWNDALARHFFRTEAAGQPVWLYVTDDLLHELGSHSAQDVPDFVSAVKAGPAWITSTASLCQHALQAFQGWRGLGLDYPPYIGYLGLFVLAAGLEGDFARHAYYPRLRALLGEGGEGSLPSFARMLELWDDLESWSTQDRHGSLGLFEARIVGGHIHVGLPIAQTILSEDERQALPKMFADAHLDPSSPPPDDELARMLRAQSGSVLRPRTRELIRSKGDLESYEVLIDTVGEELARWDGSYIDDAGDGVPGGHEHKAANLRLCLGFDRVSGRLESSLRCRIRGDFPDGGLMLRSTGVPPLSCDDSGLPGWSSPLEDVNTHQLFDAMDVDWSAGIVMTEATRGWRFSLPSRRVRIFTSGHAEGLPGWIETRQVPRGQAMYLLFRQSEWASLADWAEHECRGFQTLVVHNGIRNGWRLATCSEVTGDSTVRSKFPELAMSERVRLSLVGGIRSGSGLSYFPFAPPSLVLEGGDGSETVRCNGRVLSAAGQARHYGVPENLPLESRITLEAVRNGQPVRKISIYLSGQFEWRHVSAAPISSEWGARWQGGGIGTAGALVVGGRPETAGFRKSLRLVRGVDCHAPNIYFIGRSPGQVQCWPEESDDATWTPIWAVPLGQRGRAVFCGEDIETASPDPGHVLGTPARVQLWKQVLWHWRKKIRIPTEPLLARLWRSYIEEARRVRDW